MNWLFKIYKLKALERLHKFHEERRKSWARDWNTLLARGHHERASYCEFQVKAHTQECRKIENLIKFL